MPVVQRDTVFSVSSPPSFREASAAEDHAKPVAARRRSEVAEVTSKAGVTAAARLAALTPRKLKPQQDDYVRQ